MKKVVFLYSGEGTRSSESNLQLVKSSPYWLEINKILEEKLDLSLEKLWQEEINSHQCPNSPLLTVANGICLSDIWNRWGYKPDVVIGHSVGEITAAFQAGFYSLEDTLLLSYEIGKIAANLNGLLRNHSHLTSFIGTGQQKKPFSRRQELVYQVCQTAK